MVVSNKSKTQPTKHKSDKTRPFIIIIIIISIFIINKFHK